MVIGRELGAQRAVSKHLLVYKKDEPSATSQRWGTLQASPSSDKRWALVPYSTIYMLLYMFPDISADWLVMGEGEYAQSRTCLAPKVYNHNQVTNSTAGWHQCGCAYCCRASVNLWDTRPRTCNPPSRAQQQRISELRKARQTTPPRPPPLRLH